MSAQKSLHTYAGTDDAYATQRLSATPLVQPSPEVAAPRQRTPQRARSGPPVGRWIVRIVLALLALALIGVAATIYMIDRTYTGKIYPNIRIAGVPVGEMTPGEAKAALAAQREAFLAKPVVLTFGEHTWQPSAQDLGLSFQFDQAVESAYQSGHGHDLIADLRAVVGIWQNGLDIPLKANIDQQAILAFVRTASAEIEQPPIDARLWLDGTEVRTSPMQVGRQVQIDETVRDISEALGSFSTQTVPMRTRELLPRLRDSAVQPAQQRLSTILSEPLTLKVDAKTYTWKPETLALMLDIARVPKDSASDQISIAFNPIQVDRRLRKMTDAIGRGSVNPRVAWNGGNLVITKEGRTGLRLEEAQARSQIMAWDGSEKTLALPVTVIQPDVNAANLNTLGIRELISTGKSDFTGSAEYRIQNIGVGMQKFNGILLAPGEEFSFNENVGSIDAENGFVEGYAIIQNRTQLEFGGGICQDSTTMFRAAFWAGLPITERWGHTFYISWYDKYALGPQGDGPGMDATIFTGGPDLKFVNNTGHWMLIESSSNPTTGLAEVRMYGTKTGKTVSITQEVTDRKPAIEKPQFIADKSQPRGTSHRTDTKRGGMTIRVTRTITDAQGNTTTEVFKTVFQPWADKYALNPADIAKNGRPLIAGPWSTSAQR
ncbi:vanomycin resistance protein VanB [Chloroflexia bacterium SDU3-3]|nr:vanomycin resistance protein VanB [Chloroflexia bacterium SDU3-3]